MTAPKSLPVPAEISNASFKPCCDLVTSPVAVSKVLKAGRRLSSRTPVARCRSAINASTSIPLKALPVLAKAKERDRAAFSSAAKALAALLPNDSNLPAAKTPSNCLPSLATLFSSFCVEVSACLNALLPVYSAAISITTLAISEFPPFG